MRVHTYNPSTQEVRQEDLKIQASLGYDCRTLSQKIKKERFPSSQPFVFLIFPKSGKIFSILA
jgi:hypothetical protein